MTDSEDDLNAKCRNLFKQLQSNNTLGFSEATRILAEVRVLTREKTLTLDTLNSECLNLLVDLAAKGQTEAQMSLSNLILNYANIREQLVDPYVECVKSRLSDVLQDNVPKILKTEHLTKEQIHETLYYDLRIVFLLSALCSTTRQNIRDQLLNLILQLIMKEADESSREKYSLIIESLKILFNLTIDNSADKQSVKQVVEKLFATIKPGGIATHQGDAEESEYKDQLLVNLINLLTNMPQQVYSELSDGDADKVLRHLDWQLKTHTKQNLRDTVLPVLNVCANICNYNDNIRKKWFDKIIGSTKDYEKRPEEYDTFKGRLVKLMTSVDVHLKDMAAEFILALCGGDTDKFITYTGFGNSAAYLSTRGLLGQSANRRQESHGDEDDREYQQLREKLDPITGKLETTKVNPMEGMSEEQKEYYAHELANAITKLTNLGVVKPMATDAEGRVTELNPHAEKRDKLDPEG